MEEAAGGAVNAVNSFLIDNPDKIDDVYWILFDNNTFAVYEKVIANLIK